MPGDQIRRRTRVPPLGQISAAVDTPLKLTAGMRFHSSSVMSAVTAIGCSMPALLNAMTGRPELGGGLVEGVLYVLGAGHVAAEGKRSAAELFGSCGRFRRSHLPIDRRTAAPSRANASAVARPIPLAEPVAKFDLARELSAVSLAHRSGAHG